MTASRAICIAINFDRLPFAEHAWGKIYSADLIPFLIYPEGKYYEDKFVTHRIIFAAGKVAYEDANDYFYTIDRRSSITGKYDYKLLDLLESEKNLVSFAKQNSLSDVEAIAARNYYGHLLGLFAKFTLANQQELAEYMYQNILKERIAALVSPYTALTTRLALMVSFLPKPLLSNLVHFTEQKYTQKRDQQIQSELRNEQINN